MTKIVWKKQPSLPSGIEETFFHKIGDHLVYCCGYNGGITFSHKEAKKAKKYVRGLKRDAYCFEGGWKSIPDFPGVGRQGGRVVKVNDVLYMYGGHTFTPLSKHEIAAHRIKKQDYRSLADGYSLRREGEGKWVWGKLPDLPIPLTGFGMTAVGKWIYVIGGGYMDVDLEQPQPVVKKGREVLLNKLYRLNTEALDQGWKEYDVFPGTMRMNMAFTNIGSVLYVIGGIRSNSKWNYSVHKSDPTVRYLNVLDNWKYDLEGDKGWERLPDIYNYKGNWGCGNDQIVYKGRYIVLIGGYAYQSTICMNDGNREVIRKNKKQNEVKVFSDLVLFYDTQTGKSSAQKLGFTANVPDYVVEDDKIYFIGGESVPYILEGEKFGRHSDIYLLGKIR